VEETPSAGRHVVTKSVSHSLHQTINRSTAMRNTPRRPASFIQIERSDLYVRDRDAVTVTSPSMDGAVTLRKDSGIEPLGLTSIGVDHDVLVAGQITISVRGPDPQDAYGVELDLNPGEALRLATELTRAVVDAQSR
jgi:hypothetical protein